MSRNWRASIEPWVRRLIIRPLVLYLYLGLGLMVLQAPRERLRTPAFWAAILGIAALVTFAWRGIRRASRD